MESVTSWIAFATSVVWTVSAAADPAAPRWPPLPPERPALLQDEPEFGGARSFIAKQLMPRGPQDAGD